MTIHLLVLAASGLGGAGSSNEPLRLSNEREGYQVSKSKKQKKTHLFATGVDAPPQLRHSSPLSLSGLPSSWRAVVRGAFHVGGGDGGGVGTCGPRYHPVLLLHISKVFGRLNDLLFLRPLHGRGELREASGGGVKERSARKKKCSSPKFGCVCQWHTLIFYSPRFGSSKALRLAVQANLHVAYSQD